MNDASYFVDEHNKLAEKCNHQQAEIERLKAEVHMLHNSTSSRVLSVEIERDEAREAAREILAYFANRESDVWVKITTKYPWLEEE